jgi:hypothetical protein
LLNRARNNNSCQSEKVSEVLLPLGTRMGPVGIATGYELDDKGFVVQFLVRGREFSVLHSIKTTFRAHLPSRYLGLFLHS